jgi:hypothetical protein
MTVNNSNSSITIGGDGVTTAFTFNFVGVSAVDISIILDLNLSSQITLNPNQYTLSLNPPAPGQIWGVGGTITYPLVGSPLAVGHTLTIQRIVPLLQTTAFSNQGTNLGTAVEQALDLVEMQIQQVSNDAGQAVPGPPGSPGSAGPPGPIPRSFLAGLGLSNDVGAPQTTIDVAVGQCLADDQATTINLVAPFTKVINGLWVPGTGGAGLDVGSVSALTFYHVWVIYNPTLALTDILFSLSAISPTLPSGYTAKRRLGAMFVDGSSHWAGFTQTGDVFMLGVPQASLSITAPTSMTLTTINFLPRGVSVGAILQGFVQSASLGGNVYISETFIVSGAPIAKLFVVNLAQTIGRFQIQTNTSAQIYISSSSANTLLGLTVMGWVDTRGRNA